MRYYFSFKSQPIDIPVNSPPNGVTTLDVRLIALRVNDPEIGMEPRKDPAKFEIPNASISCVASTPLPFSVEGK